MKYENALDALHRILGAVQAQSSFEDALQILVTQVKQVLEADVVSIFLRNDESIYVLRASDGLKPSAIGVAQLQIDKGTVVGLVGQREEPINLAIAAEHLRFQNIEQGGQESFSSFLSAPLVHRKQVIGVLVSQRKNKRKFNSPDERFLTTLSAQISGVIFALEARSAVYAKLQASEASGKSRFQGTSAAVGIAIGTVFVLGYRPAFQNVEITKSINSPAELHAFKQAIDRVRLDLRQLKAKLSTQIAAQDLVLLDVYTAILSDEAFAGQIQVEIAQGLTAVSALKNVVETTMCRFAHMGDEYFRARATDIHDLGVRILTYLIGAEDQSIPKLNEPVILVGDDVSATILLEWPRDHLAGVISLQGTLNSHMAIIARAIELPAVVGFTELPMHSLHGHRVIVDGFRGEIFVNPSQGLLALYQQFLKDEQRVVEGIDAEFDQPATTACGLDIDIHANIGFLSDSQLALRRGAQGVGLFRTEISFMGFDAFPSEEEQVEIYREHLTCFVPLPVCMRTLDIGGDKSLPYFPIKETNPFLGWRGIRVTLDHPEIFMVQIRAMLRASEGLNNLQILLPMISCVEEVDESLRYIHRAFREVTEDGAKIVMPKVGVMLEVPAAVILAKTFADRVDFLSVGTNDLVQYLLAVDRNNSKVANLYQAYHPVVIQVLWQLAQEMKSFDVALSICGEIAGDPALAALLVGMGYRCLSMSASSMLRVKWVLRRVTILELENLVQDVRVCQTSAVCKDLVIGRLSSLGIGEVVQQQLLRA